MKYSESTFQTKRWKTREVMVGNVGVGGSNPVRIQSMTTSNTRDVHATVDQIIKLADYGCEIARVTVQGKKEAEACEGIKNELLKKGYTIPVVADIHFYPPAAMLVAEFVDKVRINPGNFADRRAIFKVIEYDDETYAQEILKIEEKLVPLIEKCKRLKRSIRIGTNHGSLSDRIMNRFGDSPRGMVESALEFTRVCRKYDFHDIIFSMKASNPVVMIEAYRLLVAEMMKLGWDYPLHLGVTEAGAGEDGRIKSAMGIGSLLLDGLGDTIRVSLTEDPWYEIDPCKRLVQFAEQYQGSGVEAFEEKHRDFTDLQKSSVVIPENIPLHRDGSVLLSVSNEDLKDPSFFTKLGCKVQLNQPEKTQSSVDAVVLESWPEDEKLQQVLEKLKKIDIGVIAPKNGTIVLKDLQELTGPCSEPTAVRVHTLDEALWQKLPTAKPAMILLSPTKSPLHFVRKFFSWARDNHLQIPVILNFKYTVSSEDMVIQSGAECGALLCDGLGEGVWIEANEPLESLYQISFNLLQGARMRSTKTEFISCPSCGRTLFDLQEVSARIREKTAHLPGVKIAIMGCIVNGPGEMADADFGYVGSKPEMIDLYVGKECVERNIPFNQADERLIELIKAHGRWVEPEEVEVGV